MMTKCTVQLTVGLGRWKNFQPTLKLSHRPGGPLGGKSDSATREWNIMGAYEFEENMKKFASGQL